MVLLVVWSVGEAMMAVECSQQPDNNGGAGQAWWSNRAQQQLIPSQLQHQKPRKNSPNQTNPLLPTPESTPNRPSIPL